LRTGHSDIDADIATQEQHKIMLTLLSKYTDALETHKASVAAPMPARHVIVLTGATGSLGAHILDKLVRRTDVEQVIVLARASSDTEALDRVNSSLQQRMLSPLYERTHSESSDVVAFAADLDKDHLGLSPETYAYIRDKATAVIHVWLWSSDQARHTLKIMGGNILQNGWSVNFNLGVESFEASNIRGQILIFKDISIL
jgi:Male sterility protein